MQAPKGLPKRLASVLHLVEASVRTYLVGLGNPAASVPFVYEHAKMTVLKGEEIPALYGRGLALVDGHLGLALDQEGDARRPLARGLELHAGGDVHEVHCRCKRGRQPNWHLRGGQTIIEVGRSVEKIEITISVTHISAISQVRGGHHAVQPVAM